MVGPGVVWLRQQHDEADISLPHFMQSCCSNSAWFCVPLLSPTAAAAAAAAQNLPAILLLPYSTQAALNQAATLMTSSKSLMTPFHF